MKAVLTLLLLVAGQALAEDARQLVTMPAPAQATLKQDMLDNLAAINQIVALLAEGKVKESGAVAEEKLGAGVMGRHRKLPFEARPGPHMPDAMHQLNMQTHLAAQDYARVAAKGKSAEAMQGLSTITGNCVACHLTYRIR